MHSSSLLLPIADEREYLYGYTMSHAEYMRVLGVVFVIANSLLNIIHGEAYVERLTNRTCIRVRVNSNSRWEEKKNFSALVSTSNTWVKAFRPDNVATHKHEWKIRISFMEKNMLYHIHSEIVRFFILLIGQLCTDKIIIHCDKKLSAKSVDRYRIPFETTTALRHPIFRFFRLSRAIFFFFAKIYHNFSC